MLANIVSLTLPTICLENSTRTLNIISMALHYFDYKHKTNDITTLRMAESWMHKTRFFAFETRLLHVAVECVYEVGVADEAVAFLLYLFFFLRKQLKDKLIIVCHGKEHSKVTPASNDKRTAKRVFCTHFAIVLPLYCYVFFWWIWFCLQHIWSECMCVCLCACVCFIPLLREAHACQC